MYGFSGTYSGSSELTPGQGYWINTNADGDVTISSGGAARTIAIFTDHTKEANVLSFNGSNLYFGVSIQEEEILNYQLPPKPPAGAFDVRFAGDWRYAEDNGVIEVKSNSELLTIELLIIDKIVHQTKNAQMSMHFLI